MSCLLGSATDWKIIIDYTMAPVVFPVHICVTNERPDIVLYSDSLKTVILIELTCPAEENIADARARKEIKYTPLRDQIQDNNWTCHLRTIEVGARGFVSSSVPRCLRQLGFSHSKSKELSRKVSIAAARCSFAIYKCFKVRKWEWFSPVKIDWNLFHLNADHSTLLLCNMGSTFSSPDISIDAVIWLVSINVFI